MNRFLQILATALLALGFEYLLPWWTLSIPCFLVAFLYGRKAGQSFTNGFIAIAGLWLATAVTIMLITGSGLPGQIAGLFPGGSTPVILALTMLAGGIVGGMSALTGYLFRRLI